VPINLVHSLLHRVEDGWDPITEVYARSYASFVSNGDEALVDKLDGIVGGLKGRRVLDIGAGPGQYSVLFAKRGAHVAWYDVSREYERIARARAEKGGVSLTFSLGYLEEAKRLGTGSFDLVFCKGCWAYCRSDRRFANLIYSLIMPGGVGYVECDTAVFSKPQGIRKVQYKLNAHLEWKIGHPVPPHGRIARLIQKYPIKHLDLNYSSDLRDIVTFVKSG